MGKKVKASQRLLPHSDMSAPPHPIFWVKSDHPACRSIEGVACEQHMYRYGENILIKLRPISYDQFKLLKSIWGGNLITWSCDDCISSLFFRYKD